MKRVMVVGLTLTSSACALLRVPGELESVNSRLAQTNQLLEETRWELKSLGDLANSGAGLVAVKLSMIPDTYEALIDYRTVEPGPSSQRATAAAWANVYRPILARIHENIWARQKILGDMRAYFESLAAHRGTLGSFGAELRANQGLGGRILGMLDDIEAQRDSQLVSDPSDPALGVFVAGYMERLVGKCEDLCVEFRVQGDWATISTLTMSYADFAVRRDALGANPEWEFNEVWSAAAPQTRASHAFRIALPPGEVVRVPVSVILRGQAFTVPIVQEFGVYMQDGTAKAIGKSRFDLHLNLAADSRYGILWLGTVRDGEAVLARLIARQTGLNSAVGQARTSETEGP
jgi:hypothetical protein